MVASLKVILSKPDLASGPREGKAETCGKKPSGRQYDKRKTHLPRALHLHNLPTSIIHMNLLLVPPSPAILEDNEEEGTDGNRQRIPLCRCLCPCIRKSS